MHNIKERLYFLKLWYQTIFLYPQQTLSVKDVLDYDAYWEDKRKTKDTARVISINERRRSDIVASVIGTSVPVTIGDIASGPGVIFDYLKQKITVKRWVGYDSSPRALETAKELGMETKLLDLNDDAQLSAIESADYFLMLEILEHIPNSEKILDLMYQKADKGVFFSFPNTGFFLYRLRLLFGKMPMQWRKFPNEHLRFWTDADLRWWLRALGYQNYRIFHYRGIPGLERIWPALFAGSFVVYIPKGK